MNGLSTGVELCPICWVIAHTFVNDEGVEVMYWHPRPSVPGGNADGCKGSHQPVRERAAGQATKAGDR